MLYSTAHLVNEAAMLTRTLSGVSNEFLWLAAIWWLLMGLIIVSFLPEGGVVERLLCLTIVWIIGPAILLGMYLLGIG